MVLKSDVKKIFIVDSQPVVRNGLVQMIHTQDDLRVCGEAGENNDALKKIKLCKPDLVVIEFSPDEMNGLTFPKTFKNQFPHIPLLIFTSLPETLYAERFLREGVQGYIMKQESSATVLEAIRRVLSGKMYLSPHLNEKILQKLCNVHREKDLPIRERLSAREFSVFELVGQGYNTRKIAEELNMSMKTVEAHRMHIKAKLKLSNTVSLVQRAIQWVHYERVGVANSL